MLVVEGLVHRFGLNGRPKTIFEGLSFTLQRGERLAVLGRNGQGKSTLLKILGGVLEPLGGSVEWNGMTSSWPIGFQGGFHGFLTGMDNIRFVSRLYGRPFEETFEKTEAFAELGPALTQPVRYYSTGMRARLAFGLSLAVDFDCYLIDELLAVGDVGFQRKSHAELFGLRANRTYVIATHNLPFVAENCTRALLIESGKVEFYDDVKLAIADMEARVDPHKP